MYPPLDTDYRCSYPLAIRKTYTPPFTQTDETFLRSNEANFHFLHGHGYLENPMKTKLCWEG